jgi:hypothetical protein
MRQSRRVERVVKALFGADPVQTQGELPPCVAGLQLCHWHAIWNLRQHRVTVGKAPPLRARDAIEIQPGASRRQRLERVVIDLQVKRHQGRQSGRRQIFGKIVTMAVHHVNRPPLQGLLDPAPMQLLRLTAGSLR